MSSMIHTSRCLYKVRFSCCIFSAVAEFDQARHSKVRYFDLHRRHKDNLLGTFAFMLSSRPSRTSMQHYQTEIAFLVDNCLSIQPQYQIASWIDNCSWIAACLQKGQRYDLEELQIRLLTGRSKSRQCGGRGTRPASSPHRPPGSSHGNAGRSILPGLRHILLYSCLTPMLLALNHY